jgi:hypothetical protein
MLTPAFVDVRDYDYVGAGFVTGYKQIQVMMNHKPVRNSPSHGEMHSNYFFDTVYFVTLEYFMPMFI